MLGMLLCLLMCLYVYRTNRMVVDALTAAVLLVTLYIAMQIDHTIIPGGVIGGIVISMPFLILAAKKSLRATQIVARLVFFLMASPFYFLHLQRLSSQREAICCIYYSLSSLWHLYIDVKSNCYYHSKLCLYY